MKSLGKRLVWSILVWSLVSIPVAPARAGLQWIKLELADGPTIRAALGLVNGGRGPAVIFNHGSGVRQFGHEGSIRRDGMDVTDYVRLLNRMGYTAIAPLRTKHADTAYYHRNLGPVGSAKEWMEVVQYGISVSLAARAYLTDQAGVEPGRIGIMGFSEGGNVTLWSAVKQPGYRVVVLLSPATLRNAKRYSLRNAAAKANLATIQAPMFLAVGANDMRPIRMATGKHLIPNMKALGKILVLRTDYPGNHKWFYRPRQVLVDDLEKFLGEYLK